MSGGIAADTGRGTMSVLVDVMAQLNSVVQVCHTQKLNSENSSF